MSDRLNYKRAEAAIMEVFGDTSVSKEETRGNLRGLVDHIEMLIETIDVSGDEDEGDDE